MNLIIGLTGDAMEDDILMFEQAGADAVISKPLKPSTLDKLLEYTYTFGFASPEYTHDGPGRQHLKSYIKG